VRDSSGIAIVENGRVEVIWRVVDTAFTRTLVQHADSGAVDFFGEVRALIRNDGAVVAADLNDRQVMVFDAAGGLISRWGRKGAGPGEFESIAGIALIRDNNVAVYDDDLLRIGVVAASGEIETLPSLNIGYASFLGRVPTGSWVFAGSVLFSPRFYQTVAGVIRPPEPVFLVSGARVDTVLRRLGSEIYVQRDAASVRVFEPPYPQRSFVAVAGSRIIVADAASEEIRAFDVTGQLSGIWRWTTQRIERSPEYEKEYLDDVVGAQPDLRSTIEGLVETRRVASFDRVLVDPADRVWLRTPEGPSELGNRWTVIGPEGGVLGLVHVPQECRVVAFGANDVLCRPRVEQLERAPMWLWEHRPFP
jgi:hypothetical protein